MRDGLEEAKQEKRDQAVGEFIDRLERRAAHGPNGEGELTGLSYRAPTEDDPGGLLVVKCREGDGLWVAFVGGYRLSDIMLAWRARVRKGGLRWRVDKPWTGDRGE